MTFTRVQHTAGCLPTKVAMCTFAGPPLRWVSPSRSGGWWRSSCTYASEILLLGTSCEAAGQLGAISYLALLRHRFSHTAVATNEGELYTWGGNVDGCLGFPPSISFVGKPRLVRAMYVRPKNIASNPHSVVTQSSVYNGLTPELAIDGDTSGDGEWACVHTQREKQAWWQLDLGQNASIEKIVIWNRNDVPFDKGQATDTITKRLFPCWVMASQHDFTPEYVVPLRALQ